MLGRLEVMSSQRRFVLELNHVMAASLPLNQHDCLSVRVAETK